MRNEPAVQAQVRSLLDGFRRCVWAAPAALAEPERAPQEGVEAALRDLEDPTIGVRVRAEESLAAWGRSSPARVGGAVFGRLIEAHREGCREVEARCRRALGSMGRLVWTRARGCSCPR